VISAGLLDAAAALLDACRARGWLLATAESCTGGLIAATLTAIAGASDVVDRGFVTYSNEAKMELLGVPGALIGEHGAISEPVVRAMAEGAVVRSRAATAVAVTGFAGPGGGTTDKPVGLVWFGLAQRGTAVHSESVVFPGDRTAVREATVAHAFALIRACVPLHGRALVPGHSTRG
jgi:nicotinamide-nucleotide amidase